MLPPLALLNVAVQPVGVCPLVAAVPLMLGYEAVSVIVLFALPPPPTATLPVPQLADTVVLLAFAVTTVAPVVPLGPCAPVAPAAPAAPAGPAGPAGPVAPVAPVSPLGPCAPVEPAAPVSPFRPWAP